MEQVGLSGLARHDYWSLSGGQRKRTHVARALARRPGLLLLDEATEGMDAGSQEVFLETLDELRGDGLSVVFVTHRLDIAAHHATHVALVHAGRVASGPRDEILALPEIEDAFGSAALLLRGDGALP
jgi:ABC-type Mn2+/Zn2+ transport system ATPase subunit